jgi:hypothetical protein
LINVSEQSFILASCFLLKPGCNLCIEILFENIEEEQKVFKQNLSDFKVIYYVIWQQIPLNPFSLPLGT